MSHTSCDSDCVVFAKNFIHDVISVTVAMAVDYPILCGHCTNINILLFSGNKNNVFTHHLLFVLDCSWSHSNCHRCINMKNSVCKVCIMGKMVLKVLYDIHYINNTWKKNIKNSEIILDTMFSAGKHKPRKCVALG